jgi:hypothetical protein
MRALLLELAAAWFAGVFPFVATERLAKLP